MKSLFSDVSIAILNRFNGNNLMKRDFPCGIFAWPIHKHTRCGCQLIKDELSRFKDPKWNVWPHLSRIEQKELYRVN